MLMHLYSYNVLTVSTVLAQSIVTHLRRLSLVPGCHSACKGRGCWICSCTPTILPIPVESDNDRNGREISSSARLALFALFRPPRFRSKACKSRHERRYLGVGSAGAVAWTRRDHQPHHKPHFHLDEGTKCRIPQAPEEILLAHSPACKICCSQDQSLLEVRHWT